MWLEILYKIIYLGILRLSTESHSRSDASAVYINIRKRNMHTSDQIRMKSTVNGISKFLNGRKCYYSII